MLVAKLPFFPGARRKHSLCYNPSSGFHDDYKLFNLLLLCSHMLDLSEEFDEENIATCVKYFKRMAPMKLWLEMEIGITGGEEDGVDNSAVKQE